MSGLTAGHPLLPQMAVPEKYPCLRKSEQEGRKTAHGAPQSLNLRRTAYKDGPSIWTGQLISSGVPGWAETILVVGDSQSSIPPAIFFF